MRRLLALVVLVLLGAGAVWAFVEQPWAATAEVSYRTQRADRGTIVAAVTSTGTINPISTVIVGSQLSGQVVEILADYNDQVRAQQVLARLNADQIRARRDGARADLAQAEAQADVQQAQLDKNRADRQRAQASLADVEAQVRRAEAQRADSEATLRRTTDLARRSISTEVQLQAAQLAVNTAIAALDSARAQVRSAQAQIVSLEADERVITAQLASARAAVQQRQAVIRQIEVDLGNSEIRSPVDGVVVQRNVELGQTVAASLQAPTLFLVAEDLRTMRIFANVDETDVGRVQPGQTVTFTVNAFPGRDFTGRVEQVRLGSQTVQNVVIYTAVVTVDNPGNLLLPGMTANLRILTEQRENVLRVPNAALRWRPPAEAAPTARPSGSPFAPPMPFGGPMGGGPPGAGGGGGQRPAGEGAATRQAGGGGAQQQMTAFLDAVKQELRLTAEQAAAVDAAVAEVRRGARSQFSPDMTAAQRRELFERLRDETLNRIDAALTPEQRPGFADLRRRFAEEQRRGGTTGRVHVVGADGRAQAVQLRLGASDGSYTEVLNARALADGAELIVGIAPQQQGRSWRSYLGL
jgi:HlyD family secretion protein